MAHRWRLLRAGDDEWDDDEEEWDDEDEWEEEDEEEWASDDLAFSFSTER